MTISSEIQNYLFHIQNMENIDFPKNIIEIAKLTSLFFIKPILYFFTFNWLNDILYRVNTLPTQNVNLLTQQFIGLPQTNIFQEHLILSYFSNPFFNGCFNAFFLCLPLSISHLYSIKETITNNAKIGRIALSSTVLGTITYGICLKYTNNILIEQFIKVDSLIYIISIFILLLLTYNQTEIDLTAINTPGSLSFFCRPNVKKHILFPFLLTWMEQIICFPYLQSIGDPLNNLYNYNSITSTSFYFIGILIGSLIGINLFSFGLKTICQILWNLKPINPRIWRENTNTFFNILILIFAFSSIPYYTLDYLGTSSIGFHGKEKIIQDNILQQRTNAKKQSMFVIDNMDFDSFDTKSTRMDLIPIEDVLYRAEKDIINRQNRQSALIEQYAKNWMHNILNKLGIKLNEEDTNVKEQKEIVGTNRKTSYSSFSPSASVARRFQNYGKFEKNKLNSIFTQTAFIDSTIGKPIGGLNAKIKTKYYDNAIYKTILKGDINLFLTNQTKNEAISNKEFSDILRTQRALENYNNSIRKYRTLPYKNDFYKFFNGSRSFSNKLTSHQAKGSLRIVRRLFRIDINSMSNNEVQKFLSYDQPLFNKESVEQTRKNFIHEELKFKNQKTLNLKSWSPIPLYAGWDNKNHQYILTNRYINENGLRKDNLKSQIFITSFPYQTKDNYQQKQYLNNLLSIPNTDERYKAAEKILRINYSTAPITTTLYQQQQQFLPPDRGIFIW